MAIRRAGGSCLHALCLVVGSSVSCLSLLYLGWTLPCALRLRVSFAPRCGCVASLLALSACKRGVVDAWHTDCAALSYSETQRAQTELTACATSLSARSSTVSALVSAKSISDSCAILHKERHASS